MPLPAALVPDCTTDEAHKAAYKKAKSDNSIFVCIARRGSHWTVEIDVISRPLVAGQAGAVLQAAVDTLVATGVAAGGAYSGPEYISLRKIEGEERAREIAAAFHAAMYGLQQLHIAVPSSLGSA